MGVNKTEVSDSGEPPSGRGFLDQALQRQAHRVVIIGSAEAGAAKLQRGDEAHKEDAAAPQRTRLETHL